MMDSPEPVSLVICRHTFVIRSDEYCRIADATPNISTNTEGTLGAKTRNAAAGGVSPDASTLTQSVTLFKMRIKRCHSHQFVPRSFSIFNDEA